MTVWSERFSKELDDIAAKYNSSISVDWVMYKEDIDGSIAHSQMLAEVGIITQEEAEAIKKGLEEIKGDIESGALEIDPSSEDIHMFVETELTKRIGEPGKKLHSGRSRNDQVAVDVRLYLRNRSAAIMEDIKGLIGSLVDLAEDNVNTLMPGYTHLQGAQPVTFAHHLLAYGQMLVRDYSRFKDAVARMNESPLGAGALATTVYPIDRQMTAAALGFDKPMANSMDAVSDRDFIMELEFAASLTMVHLSRFAEELIIWSTPEFNFVQLDDAFTTGSSIMPQKKNPDMAELCRGKTGTIIGILTGMLSTMKGTPLAYNKDMQEDKDGIFRAFEIIEDSLKVFIGMVSTMTVFPEVMAEKAGHGYLNATDLADYLAEKGIPFREGYGIVGRIVKEASDKKSTLEDLNMDFYKKHSSVFGEDLYEAISLDNSLARRNVYGGPAPEAVAIQIQELREYLKK